jgi:alpha-L-fucosidase 2
MLVQSHRRADLPGGERRHVIELLPALPKAWPAGAVSGLRARGGFEVSMKWANGKLTYVELKSMDGNPCVLRVGDRSVENVTTVGGSYRFDGELVADGIF